MKVYEDLIAAIEEMINTGTSVMAPYPCRCSRETFSFWKKIKLRKVKEQVDRRKLLIPKYMNEKQSMGKYASLNINMVRLKKQGDVSLRN